MIDVVGKHPAVLRWESETGRLQRVQDRQEQHDQDSDWDPLLRQSRDMELCALRLQGRYVVAGLYRVRDVLLEDAFSG